MVKKIALSVLIAGLIGSQAFASLDKMTKFVNAHNVTPITIGTTVGTAVGTALAFNRLVNRSGPLYDFGALKQVRTNIDGKEEHILTVRHVDLLGFGVQAKTPAQGDVVSNVLNTTVSVQGVTVKRTLAAAVACVALKYGLPFVHQGVAKALPKK